LKKVVRKFAGNKNVTTFAPTNGTYLFPQSRKTMIAYIAFWTFIATLGTLVGLHLIGEISDVAYATIVVIIAIALLSWCSRSKKAEH
jgi:hypothetical protein